tara:strand:+ start:1948 stop:3156 length:1209 start_codon:yes stop_codon:yes gene_type:complete
MYIMKNKVSTDLIFNKLEKNPFEIFSDDVLNFLDYFSKLLLKGKESRKYPDLITFGFWIRKRNLLQKKVNYNFDNSFQIGRGIIYNIAPSNVPMNGPFSLVFSLLSGNNSILKIPSKKHPQLEIFFEQLELAIRKFECMNNRIKILNHEKKFDLVQNIIDNVDGIVVWGSDATIQSIEKHSFSTNFKKLYFPNRNSFVLISKKSLIGSDLGDINNLSENFYNDTLIMDQNACSSPRVIFWLDDIDSDSQKNKFEIKKNDFIASFEKLIKTKYEQNEETIHFKLNQLLKDSGNDDYKVPKNFSLNFTLIKSNSFDFNKPMLNRFGYFYEVNLDEINCLNPFLNKRIQTISYYGINKDQIDALLNLKLNKGVDRIVPIGKAIDIDLQWDGIDFINELSRKITIL